MAGFKTTAELIKEVAEQKERFLSMMRLGTSMARAARFAKVHQETVSRWLLNDKTFRCEVRKAILGRRKIA